MAEKTLMLNTLISSIQQVHRETAAQASNINLWN